MDYSNFVGGKKMKKIPLTQGYFTFVDDADYDYLNNFEWRIQRNKKHIYARTNQWLGNGKSKTIFMHRLLLNADKTDLIDHKDGNALNNQRQNLRICNSLQNNYNARHPGTSGYIGVHFNKKQGAFNASIQAKGKKLYLGSFDNPLEAALVRDEKAIELHGEFAKLNFPLTK
jgi:hypothetical protein